MRQEMHSTQQLVSKVIIHVERCSESNVNPLLALFLVSTTA